MRPLFRMSVTILALILAAACRAEEDPPAAPEATSTPDPCLEAYLPAEIDKVNTLTREFDDYATLASNTPKAQLVTVIPELQRILREAEDQNVPACLVRLKELQISHMNTVVQTLLAFVGNADATVVNSGIGKSRDLHSQYEIEMARLLGITVVVATPVLTATLLPATEVVVPTATPEVTVINPGPNELNLRNAPDFNAAPISVLPVDGSTTAIGRTADNQWIMVRIPGDPEKTAWVYEIVIEISAPIETLPVVTP